MIVPILITLLIAVVCVYLINLIPFPADLDIVRIVLICIVVFTALFKLVAFL